MMLLLLLSTHSKWWQTAKHHTETLLMQYGIVDDFERISNKFLIPFHFFGSIWRRPAISRCVCCVASELQTRANTVHNKLRRE